MIEKNYIGSINFILSKKLFTRQTKQFLKKMYFLLQNRVKLIILLFSLFSLLVHNKADSAHFWTNKSLSKENEFEKDI